MEDPSSSKESQQSYQAVDQGIMMLESQVGAKEESMVTLNQGKKECTDVAVQANYLVVTECKTAVTLCYSFFTNYAIILFVQSV